MQIAKKNIAMKLASSTNIAALLLMLVVPVLTAQTTNAAPLQEAMVQLDRMGTGATGSAMACFTTKNTPTVATVDQVKVTFHSNFNVAGVALNNANVTTKAAGTDFATPTLLTGTATPALQVVTLTGFTGPLAANTDYCFGLTGVVNGSAGNDLVGSISLVDSTGPTTIQTSRVALAIVGSNADRIQINAQVNPMFSMALDDNDETFASVLDTNAVYKTPGELLTITTNAFNGWNAWIKSDNQALASAVSGGSIPTTGTINGATSTLVAGTSGYVLGVDQAVAGTNGTSTTPAVNAEYSAAAASDAGGTLGATYNVIATGDGTTDGDTVTLTAKAAVSAVQEAANDYIDYLTVVAAGMF